MTNKTKIVMIVSAIAGLDYIYGFDPRFTIINLIWCIPFAYAIIVNKEK